MIKDLIDKGLWNKEMRDTIILHEGSIQNIPNIDATMVMDISEWKDSIYITNHYSRMAVLKTKNNKHGTI